MTLDFLITPSPEWNNPKDMAMLVYIIQFHEAFLIIWKAEVFH